ncbi:MAG: PEP-CTERM sorting domain-containing protein, partial [Candidatus Auribacterota bacterium]
GSDDNSICSNGSTFLVTWRGVNNLFGQYLGLNGELIGEQFIVNDDTYETVNFSDIASDGENYFVVWEASTTRAADEHYDIYGKILQPIPEPSAIFLFLTGLGWMIFYINPNRNKL